MPGPQGPFFYQSGQGGSGSSSLTAPTKQLFTSAPGTVTGYVFSVSGISTAPTAGATYTNNSVTYTVIGITNSNTVLWVSVSGAQTLSGTTLTKATGTGDSTITFVGTATQSAWAPQKLGTYTTPAGANWLKVSLSGGGGGGGGTASSAATSGAGAGGGGGGAVIKWISSPSGSYYYTFGAGGSGGSAGNNTGIIGGISGIGSGSTFYIGFGGSGGSGSIAATGSGLTNGPAPGANATGGDMNIPGGYGLPGTIFTTITAEGGAGGSSVFGAPVPGGYNTQAGNPGNSYSTGGGGGSQINNGGATGGGTGAGGLVLVEEFYQ